MHLHLQVGVVGEITLPDYKVSGNRLSAGYRFPPFELLVSGVLNDENNQLTNKMKCKILEMLGMGNWENAQDINELHIKKASNENLKLLKKEELSVSEIDNHELHINEHIAFMLGEDFEKASKKDSKIEEEFLKHIKSHKKYKNMEE